MAPCLGSESLVPSYASAVCTSCSLWPSHSLSPTTDCSTAVSHFWGDQDGLLILELGFLQPCTGCEEDTVSSGLASFHVTLGSELS